MVRISAAELVADQPAPYCMGSVGAADACAPDSLDVLSPYSVSRHGCNRQCLSATAIQLHPAKRAHSSI